MSLDKLPVEWSVTGLESLSEFIIGGDWGKDLSFADESYIDAFCIRGSEFKNWKTDKGKTAVPRKLKISSLNTRRLKVGDILVEISGGGPDQPVGRTVYIEELVFNNLDSEDIVCTNFLRLFRPISSINAKYLNFYLSFFYKTPEIVNYQSGSNNLRNLQFKDYLKLEIPMAPLAEQQEIVRQLDMMLAQVEQIKARLDVIPAILKKFRQSVLADAVSGKLTEEWREQNNLPLANIEKLERVVDSSFYGPRFSKDDYTDDLQNGIPTIRTTDMSDGKIIVTPTTPRIIVPPEKIEQFKVKPSDLLITRTGSIGVMALVREEYLAIPSAYLIRFRFKQNLVSSDYIYYALTSPNGQNQMGLSTTAITQPNINANSIRALEIYLPSIEEQKEIVKRVDTLFGYAARIEETIQSAQKRVNLLTQSILAKAFSGELTAEWREQHQELIIGINSAESLLAAIQAEREASKPAKKTRKKKEV